MYKQVISVLSFITLSSCGKVPASHLSEQFPILRSGPYDMEFSFIPSGAFRMGSPEDEYQRDDNETRHWVRLTQDYWMQTTEVTVGQWYAVMGVHPKRECWELKGAVHEHHYPVVCVNYDEVLEFVRKLNDQTKNDGYTYYLPTESQWKYAARAYTETPYSIKGEVGSFAWYLDNSKGQIHPPGQLKANLFGLYDVHGNLWEWNLDWYAGYPKAETLETAVIDPKGPKKPNKLGLRMLSGGSWNNPDWACRSAHRFGGKPDGRFGNLGFRVIRISD